MAQIENGGSSTSVDAIVMRRYMLFGGDCYYAAGGFHDFRGSFDSISEAVADATTRRTAERHTEPVDWWHVIDRETWEVVAKSETKPHGAEELPNSFA